MPREITNQDRAENGGAAVLAHALSAGQYNTLESPEVLGDLLCDLRHWAAAKGVDFERCASNSAMQFAEEVADAS